MSQERHQLLMELAAHEAELRRRSYLADPARWVQERLKEHIWSKQRDVLESVRDNRRTAVPSCHQAGKSFIAARAAAWWLENYPVGESLVVTTAPTGRQVRAILWREINRAHAHGNLSGRTNQTEWWMEVPGGKEEMVAVGMKPSEYDPAAFQGMHARRVLLILDEASGIPLPLWEDADSLIANDESRILAIGNPDDSRSEFFEVCKPGSGWKVIHIGAYDTPNFTGEVVPDAVRRVLIGKTWVDEKRKKWGEGNPLWIAKVLGQFPDANDDGLIPLSWVKRAQLAELSPEGPNELGVDVGGGGDRNVVAHRRGPVLRIRLRNQVADTMVSCGNVIAVMRAVGATKVKVDEIGIGKGLYDRGKELGLPFVGVNVGREPTDKEQFTNLRAQGYWGFRERFELNQVDLDPDDDDLAAQLVDIRFKRTSSGKIQIESKEEMKRRGRDSPDDADASMLAFLPDHLCPQEVRELEIMWG